MMKSKFQKEMENIRLSEAAKRRMATSLEKPTASVLYKVTLPAFIVLAVFALVLFEGSNGPQLTNQASAPSLHVNDAKYMNYFKDIFWWMFASLVLYIPFAIQVTLLPLFTKRYAHRMWNRRYRHFMQRSRTHIVYMLLVIFVHGLLIGLLFVGPFFLFTSVLLYKTYCLTFLTLNITAILCWRIRNEELPVCPHCGKQITKKQLRRMMWAISSVQCGHCDGKLYQSKASRTNSSLGMVYFIIGLVGQFLNLPVLLILLHLAFCFAFLLLYFLKYVMQYTIEDEPLW